MIGRWRRPDINKPIKKPVLFCYITGCSEAEYERNAIIPALKPQESPVSALRKLDLKGEIIPKRIEKSFYEVSDIYENPFRYILF